MFIVISNSHYSETIFNELSQLKKIEKKKNWCRLFV